MDSNDRTAGASPRFFAFHEYRHHIPYSKTDCRTTRPNYSSARAKISTTSKQQKHQPKPTTITHTSFSPGKHHQSKHQDREGTIRLHTTLIRDWLPTRYRCFFPRTVRQRQKSSKREQRSVAPSYVIPATTTTTTPKTIPTTGTQLYHISNNKHHDDDDETKQRKH